MPAMSLNHYTINARDLDATKNFYTDVVGLAVGDRPPLAFPGHLRIIDPEGRSTYPSPTEGRAPFITPPKPMLWCTATHQFHTSSCTGPAT